MSSLSIYAYCILYVLKCVSEIIRQMIYIVYIHQHIASSRTALINSTTFSSENCTMYNNVYSDNSYMKSWFQRTELNFRTFKTKTKDNFISVRILIKIVQSWCIEPEKKLFHFRLNKQFTQLNTVWYCHCDKLTNSKFRVWWWMSLS